MLFSVLSVLFSVFLATESWPSGAPEKTCSTLKPIHGSNIGKSASESPYTLTQSHQDYKAGEKVRVDLRAPAGLPFKGLMVQAYDPKTNSPIGRFLPGKGLKTYDSCSAVTHTDKRGKRGAMLIWEAPQGTSGRVAFRGTVVKKFSEFYENLQASLDKGAASQ
ncbi:putative ferric-chelate reductase 1 homolog [Brevipalpus obovatus]|uniref:putative ferric-chelate reductase 1 homolog n=1 Tax=Brevipalpus obovatus TaxID=246614 RepID=UPI003D9EA805